MPINSRVQTLRSSTALQRPPSATRSPGELYVNFPDLQLGVIDAAQAPQDLLAIRRFSTLTSYSIGDFVVQSGQLYRASAPSAAGAFTPANWSVVFNAGNDGAGSTADADLLDGQQGSWYQDRANHTGSQAQSTVTNLVTDLAAKAPIASPTFTGKATTAASAAGGAGFNLPHGAAPTSPANGDVWTTTAGVFARINGVTTGPLGAIAIGDAPPANPNAGQLWWESDSGRMYIYYNDGNTSQWVQVNGSGVAEPPADDGEYVRVNGVWRLKSQSFVPGSTGQNIAVPTTAKMAKITAKLYAATQPATVLMRVSADGSTFLAGASDYSFGGSISVSGSNTSPVKTVTTAAANLTLGSNIINMAVPMIVNATLVVNKAASAVFFAQWRSSFFATSATEELKEYTMSGYPTNAALSALTQLPAFQIICGSGTLAASSSIDVEWIY